MEKIERNSVQYLYPGLTHPFTDSIELKHNDPTKIEFEDYCLAFRFCKKILLFNKESWSFDEKIVDPSNWFYTGKKLTFGQVKKLFGNDPKYAEFIKNLQRNKISKVCITKYGDLLAMNDEDITLDEYICEHSREKQCLTMFENLKKHIGDNIIYKVYRCGKEEIHEDILR